MIFGVTGQMHLLTSRLPSNAGQNILVSGNDEVKLVESGLIFKCNSKNCDYCVNFLVTGNSNLVTATKKKPSRTHKAFGRQHVEKHIWSPVITCVFLLVYKIIFNFYIS